MKTKCFKTLLMLFVMSLFAKNLFAQGAYVNINAGYGLSMSSQNIEGFNNSSSNNNGSSSSASIEQVNVSLGKGFNVGGAFGYMFNNNIGAELGISYLLGGNTTVKNSSNDNFGGSVDNRTTNITISSNMFRINPSLVIASGFEKINPYAKFGLVLGFGSIMYDVNENDNGDIRLMKIKLNGGIALGLNAGVGALFKLSDKMTFFSELNMVNLSYAPTNGEKTESTKNGVDELPNMTTREKQIEFVDSYTFSGGNPPPYSQPSQELKQKFPLGSFGLNFGLRIGI